MNVGFANLSTLKKQLLAPALVAATDYDARITALGLGVAEAMGNYCNRKFARAVGTTEILPADRCQFLLARYPIESISAIDLKMTEAEGWVAQTVNEFLRTIDQKSGIVNCPAGADAGPWDAQVRFTYTGGFWWEQLEPTDNGYPASQPSGSNALPNDLKLAWLLQCELIWKMSDKLGTDIGEGKAGRDYELQTLALSPQVKTLLGQFVRYNLV